MTATQTSATEASATPTRTDQTATPTRTDHSVRGEPVRLIGAAGPLPHRRLQNSATSTRLGGGVRLRPTGAAVAAPAARAGGLAGRLSRLTVLGPGWPLRYLLLGYPLWWVLGMGTFIFPLLALPMAAWLWRNRPLRFPPAFTLWLLSLAWIPLGMVMFGTSPPGTHPSGTGSRLVSIAFEFVMSLVVTIVLLYVGNLRKDEVPQERIARWLGTFFYTVLAGGYLGIVLPHLSFRSPVELLLPNRLASDSYVQVLVHPVSAQVQAVIGEAAGRPAAPFGYTNTWGNVISILLVWFVATRVLPATGWRRFGYTLTALLAVVPVVMSLNRGLWIGLIFTGLWLGLRQVLQGRIGALLAGAAALLVGAGIFVLTPLHTVIGARLNNGASDSIRTFVARQSLRAMEHSPLLGYGGTRHTNGSASSIAVGPTPSCGNCGNVATGSTGQLWATMFNHGLVGILCYYGFFAVGVWVFRRQRGRIAESALVTIMLTFVYMTVYSDVLIAPSLTMIAFALLWRDHEPGARVVHHRRRALRPRGAGGG